MDQKISGYDAAEFRRRAVLHHPEESVEGVAAHLGHGDHVLNSDLVGELSRKHLRDAAVLVPVVDRGGGATVILTRRATSMRKHSGQVAFPGGAVDPEDGTAEMAAIREAEEEIGLARDFVEIAGRLPVYLTTTGFRVTPVLSVVREGFSLKANADEVDEIFEVPLSFLMNPANHHRESRFWEGRERHYYVMPYGSHHIWGVTAGIIRILYERLYR